MDLRSNIRKIVLQEIYSRILLEQADGNGQESEAPGTVNQNARDILSSFTKTKDSSPPAKKLNVKTNDGRFPTAEAAQQAKDLLIKNADMFSKGVEAPDNGVKLDTDTAIRIAGDLYEATEAWSLSASGLMSGKIGAIGTDEAAIIKALGEIPTLADLSHVSKRYSEMHNGYDLAETLEEEYGTFTSDEFYLVKRAIEKIYEKGLFVLDGNVITIEMLEEIAEVAEKNKEALEKAQGSSAEGGGFDLAGLVGGTAGAAGIAAGSVIGTGAALGAVGLIASSGGGAAAVATGVAAAVGAIIGAPVILTALAVTALGVGLWTAFDNEDFDEKELKMLSPDFYNGLKEMFKSLSQNFRDAADGIDPSQYPSESDLSNEETPSGTASGGADGGECPPLGWGLEAPYVQNIIKTMNAYAVNKGVEGYKEAPVSSSWSQDDQVQKSWLVFAKHALENCDLYGSFKDLDVNSWKDMSKAMKSTYPGYTPNPKGCLAFCLDAYCCKLTWGDQAPSRGGGRGGGGGGGGGGGEDEPRPRQPKLAEGGGHEVTLNLTGKNFKKSGFTMSNDENPDEIFLLAIITNMTASSTRGGYPGGQVSFKFNVRNGKVVDVDRVVGSRLTGQLNGIRIIPAIKSLNDAAKLLVIPERFKDEKVIRVTFRITGGQIDDVRARARRA